MGITLFKVFSRGGILLVLCSEFHFTVKLERLYIPLLLEEFKDLNSTVAKMGSVLIGLMTPNGAIWFRYIKGLS